MVTKTALQLYSIRSTLLTDLEDQLRQVKEMGYDGAEFVNFGGDSVDRIAKTMKTVGLELFSIHTSMDEILASDEGRIAHYADLGCRYMPIGWLPDDRLAGGVLYAETLEAVRSYSALCGKHGIRLLYHNHDFDFMTVNGVHRLDILYADTDSDVLGAELDTCWIYSGAENPLAYVNRYGSRCPVLHLKDCVKEGGRSGFRALGEGVLDFPPILAAADAAGIEWVCVEQDEPTPGRTPMECAEMSIRYLKTFFGK